MCTSSNIQITKLGWDGDDAGLIGLIATQFWSASGGRYAEIR